MAPDQLELPRNLHDGVMELVKELERAKVRYALIGGLAAGYRSRPRFTRDIDLLLEIPQLVLPGLLDNLRARGFELDPLTIIRQWTQEHFTVFSFHGVRVDWLKPLLPLYKHVLDIASSETWFGHSIWIASAEGLILMKLLAYRMQDQVDIQNLLAANRGQLNLEWISKEWTSAGDVEDPRWRGFTEMVDRYYHVNG